MCNEQKQANSKTRLERKNQDFAFWEKGAASVLYYLMLMVLISVALLVFSEYFHAYVSVGQVQTYADILADGTCYIGDTGWGLDEKKAKKAYFSLQKYNEDYFVDASIADSPEFKYIEIDDTDKDSIPVISTSKEEDGNNAVIAKAEVTATTLSSKQEIGKSADTRNKTAVTMTSYSGGMKIVMEAYKHTYEYQQYNHTQQTQTAYRWGGGHSPYDNWEALADCSGFVDGIYRKCGYNIGYGTTVQLETTGTHVASSYAEAIKKARPGDIVLYWYKSARAGASEHALIYAGLYKGVPYVVECKGGSDLHYYYATGENSGPNRGCHIDQMKNPLRIEVRRIVKGSGEAHDLSPVPTITGMNSYQRDLYLALRSLPDSLTDVEIASLMGVWNHESGCNPQQLEISNEKNIVYQTYHGLWWQAGNESFTRLIRNNPANIELFCDPVNGYGAQGFGLAQWTTTSPTDNRKRDLFREALMTGQDVTSLQFQLSYAMKELHQRNFEEFRREAAKGTRAAVEWLTANYEGVPNDNIDSRLKFADKFLSCM